MERLPDELLCRLFADQDFETKRLILPLVCKRWNDILATPLRGSCVWGDIILDLSVFGTILYQRYKILKPQYPSLKAASISLSSYATSFFQRFSLWLSKRAGGIRDVTIHGFLSRTPHQGKGNEPIVVDNVKSLVTAYFLSSWFPDLLRSLPAPEQHVVLHFEGNLCGAPYMKQPESLPALQKAISEIRYTMAERDGLQTAAENLQYFTHLKGLQALEIGLRLMDGGVIAQLEHLSSLQKLHLLTIKTPGGLVDLPRIGNRNLETLVIHGDLRCLPPGITSMPKIRSLTIEGVLNKYPMNVCVPGLEEGWWPVNPGGLVGLKSLTFAKCGIMSLSPSLGLLSQLQTLDLSMNGLRGYQNIAVMGQLTTLKRLVLSGNLFSNTDKLGQLCDLQSLTEIDLSNNVFLFIPKVLLQMRQLKKIDLSGNHITLTRTLFGLAELSELRSLHVGLNTTTRSISEAMLVKYHRDVLGKFPASDPCRLNLKVSETRSLWWTGS
ncbi:hypothetical protein BSKO_10498 [Bryopsis sp. KO-2023]|nr:hypothetical protein BSKO_10498 [Bryopsis sp. KO-2023]